MFSSLYLLYVMSHICMVQHMDLLGPAVVLTITTTTGHHLFSHWSSRICVHANQLRILLMVHTNHLDFSIWTDHDDR